MKECDKEVRCCSMRDIIQAFINQCRLRKSRKNIKNIKKNEKNEKDGKNKKN